MGSTTKRWYDIYAGNKVDIGGASILGSNTGLVITKPTLIDQLLISDNLITPDSLSARQYSGDKGWLVINGNLQVEGDELAIPVVQTVSSNIPTFADNSVQINVFPFFYNHGFMSNTVFQILDYNYGADQLFNGAYDNLVAGDYIQFVYTNGTTQDVRLTSIAINYTLRTVQFSFDPLTYAQYEYFIINVRAQNGFTEITVPPIGGTEGAIRYNNDLQGYQRYSNSQWTSFGVDEFKLSGACGTVYSSEAGNGGRGKNNFFVGFRAGERNTTGCNNNFFGAYAGACSTTGSYNNFFGKCAGPSAENYVTSVFGEGCHNNFFGQMAGHNNTTGSSNNFFGVLAGRCNTTGSNNFFAGFFAGTSNTLGSCNNFFGPSAGRYNTTGSSNNFFGAQAGQYNTTGINNNFFGFSAGRYNSTGSSNNFFGDRAGYNNTTGYNNNFFGSYAGRSSSAGNNNNFFGFSAGRYNSTGSNNNFFGSNAGIANTTGSNNNFFGACTGQQNTTGCFNTFIGPSAGCRNTTGTNNIFFGHNSGTTGLTPGGLANITTESNRIIMGNASHTCAQIQIAWTTVSDARDKCIYGAIDRGLGFLKNVNPIEFAFKDRITGELKDPEGKRRYGFSAQDILALEGADPVIVSTENPDQLQMTNDYLIPILVNAVKELSAQVEELKFKLDQLAP